MHLYSPTWKSRPRVRALRKSATKTMPDATIQTAVTANAPASRSGRKTLSRTILRMPSKTHADGSVQQTGCSQSGKTVTHINKLQLFVPTPADQQALYASLVDSVSTLKKQRQGHVKARETQGTPQAKRSWKDRSKTFGRRMSVSLK